MRTSNQSGIAMITVLLVLMLMSALLVGFTTVVMSDQRYRFIDRDRNQAFYAASAGVEKLTADLGNLFLTSVAPTTAQVTALTAPGSLPTISGITFAASQAPQALPASLLTPYHCLRDPITGENKLPTPVGTNGYVVTFCKGQTSGNPTTSDNPLTVTGTGAYSGMTALQTPYQIDVTAKTSTGGEVHLVRTMEAVAIPVFQFIMFSEPDLSVFPGPDFSIGGRVHTNGNLWLASGAGNTLTTAGKWTAAKDIIRAFLSNGAPIASNNSTGTVSMATAAAAPLGNRNLATNEGSIVGMPGTAVNPNWQTISLGATPANYNGYLLNGPFGVTPPAGGTGAKRLNLPLTAPGIGGTNVDIIRRPPLGEPVLSVLYNERLANKTSIRILLSDTAADIINMPGIAPGAPIQLDGDWRAAAPFAGYVGVPIARSMGQLGTLTTTTAAVAAGAVTIPVAAMPVMFQKPQLTVQSGGVIKAGPFTCTTWTETSFTGCGAHAALNLGWTIYVGAGLPLSNGNMPGAAPPSATINAAALNSGTITLTAPQTTWEFAANTFFINDVAAGGTGLSTPVTCTGATLVAFTGCTNVPAARNGATITTGYATNQNNGTIGGFLKIEKLSIVGGVPTWGDVTQEIMNYGISAPSQDGLCSPTPNAIVQLQRARDTAGAATCSIGDTTNSYEYWPNVLFDSREGMQRDDDPGTTAGLQAGGAMSYIQVNARNLALWFKGQAPYNLGTGNTALTNTGGFSIYFSDRRSNRNNAGLETAEYGWEDFVNPGVANGVPNGICEPVGEDVNENNLCEVYGRSPTYNGVFNTIGAMLAPYAAAMTPTSLIKRAYLQVNRPVFFRRALKLVNGGTLGSEPVLANRIAGFTAVSENPVYIQGDWNAAATFAVNDPHAATSVIADAVTFLSGNWDDGVSFDQAYNAGARSRPADVYYRVAILAGKGKNFPLVAADNGQPDFGTDGGAHNFLRMLESGGTFHYRGSMATLFYNRQAVGTYKCCTTVYGAPTRAFVFDQDFTQPALLPPLTPMFRDMNVVGFSQELRPGK
jgi:hypothetical protein